MLAAFLCLPAAASRADNLPPPPVAGHFAPEPSQSLGPQQRLLQIFLNGIDQGVLKAIVNGQQVVLPAETLATLRLPGTRLDLAATPGITYTFDDANSILRLTVPVTMLQAMRLQASAALPTVRLSPETWGAWANYDLNVRRQLSAAAGTQMPQGVHWGGDVTLNATGPDLLANSSWAYDSQQESSPIRLDNWLTWRPAEKELAVSGGDAVSSNGGVLTAARPYRFVGLVLGTDHSGQPEWTSTPIPSVSGTAQAESSVDVFVNGQRAYHTETPGGTFSLAMPRSAFGQAATVIVTDVTGRSQFLSLEAPYVDARLVSGGTFLWSAALGAPRFNYGSADTTYQSDVYGYADGRYGITDEVTATAHAEGGAGIAEFEGGINAIPIPRLAIKTLAAASHSRRGSGASGGLGLAVYGPWGLSLDLTGTATSSGFDDVVSASARTYSKLYKLPGSLSLPSRHEASARATWQVLPSLQLSLSYQEFLYPNTPLVNFESVSANWNAWGVPVFFNLSCGGTHGHEQTAALFGLSFSFGRVQASASAGAGSGHSFSGGVQLDKPLLYGVGDTGWNVNAQRTPGLTYVDADAEVRTGYGIPGASVQAVGSATTLYSTLRGAVGFADAHPFLADPILGGMVIANTGVPGLPVTLNNDPKGKTGADGKLAVPIEVPETPQRVALDTDRVPINVLPGETQQQITIRQGGVAAANFQAKTDAASAIVIVTVDGKPPPIGSMLVGADDSAPVDKRGRGYLSSIRRNEVLELQLPDGSVCKVATHFDGHGGVMRRLGPLPCVPATS